MGLFIAKHRYEAIQFTGHNYDEVVAWIEKITGKPERARSEEATLAISLPSVNGGDAVNPTDWIIRGRIGGFMVFPDVRFHEQFETVPTGGAA